MGLVKAEEMGFQSADKAVGRMVESHGIKVRVPNLSSKIYFLLITLSGQKEGLCIYVAF